MIIPGFVRRPSPGARSSSRAAGTGTSSDSILTTYFALKMPSASSSIGSSTSGSTSGINLTFDLRELAHECVGLSRTYGDAGKLKAKLQPGPRRAGGDRFPLEPMSAADRYSKTGRGAWNIRFVRKLPPPAEVPPAETKPPEPKPTGLEKELVERGVTLSVAAELVRDFPADRITAQLERLDWLRETKPKRVKDVGAYLADAIRKDFAAPAGFKGKAERAEGRRPRGAAGTAGAGPPGSGPARSSRGSRRTRRTCPRAAGRAPGRALASADPAARAAYEAATGPPRLLQVGLRDAHIRACWACPRRTERKAPSRPAPTSPRSPDEGSPVPRPGRPAPGEDDPRSQGEHRCPALPLARRQRAPRLAGSQCPSLYLPPS